MKTPKSTLRSLRKLQDQVFDLETQDMKIKLDSLHNLQTVALAKRRTHIAQICAF